MIECCVSDVFTGQYRDEAAFMAALADALNIECARENIRHVEIVSVDWRKAEPPAATVCIRPGGSAGLASVERLRAAYTQARKAAQKTETVARSVRELEEQGRLI